MKHWPWSTRQGSMKHWQWTTPGRALGNTDLWPPLAGLYETLTLEYPWQGSMKHWQWTTPGRALGNTDNGPPLVGLYETLTLEYQRLSFSPVLFGRQRLICNNAWAQDPRFSDRGRCLSVRECKTRETWEMREPAAILRAEAVSISVTDRPLRWVRVRIQPMVRNRRLSTWIDKNDKCVKL